MSEDSRTRNIGKGLIGVVICLMIIIGGFITWNIISANRPALSNYKLLDTNYSTELNLYVIKLEANVDKPGEKIDSQDFSLYVYGAPRSSKGFATSNYTYRYIEAKDQKIYLFLAFDAPETLVDKPIRLLYKGNNIL